MSTRLDGLYFDVALQTQGFDADVKRVGRVVSDLGKVKIGITVTADATPVTQVTAALNDVTAAQGRATEGTKQLANGYRGLAAAAVAYKAIQYAKEAIALADAYTNVRSRLSLVTNGVENLNAVQAKLFQVSQDTRSDLESNVALYTSLARATKTLGLSQEQLVSITKTVGQSFLISGASASESAAATRQLGQALASGVLRGDEFNSIAENAPRLQQAVADSLGITIGQLRKYAEEGKITAAVVTKALLQASASIDAESAKIALTVGGAMTQVKNALLLAVGQFDKASGASAALASALAGLAKETNASGVASASSATKWGLLSAALGKTAAALLTITNSAALGGTATQRIEALRAGFSNAADAVVRYVKALRGIDQSTSSDAGTPFSPRSIQSQSASTITVTATKAEVEAAKDAAKARATLNEQFVKSEAAAQLALQKQEELTAAVGAGKRAIEDINAAYELKAKLASIDEKLTTAQIARLTELAVNTASQAKAETEAARALEDAQANVAARQAERLTGIEQEKKAREEQIKLNEKLQKSLRSDSERLTGKSQVGKQADDSSLLAAGLLAASNEAARLADRLGAGGSELGKLASAGIKLAGILKAVNTAQEVGSSATATSAQKLSAKTDVFALVIGGVIELAGALDVFGSKAKERANEMREAARVFNLALADFAVTDRTDLEQKLKDNLRAADELAAKAASSVGFKTTGTGTAFQATSAADVQAEIDRLRVAAAGAAASGKSSGKALAVSLSSFADQLQLVADETLKNETKLKIAHDAQVKRDEEDLQVRALVAAGRSDDAAALRLQFEQQRELSEAQKDTTDSGKAYVAHLKDVQGAEAAAAEATRKLANAQRILDDDITLFGLKGQDAFNVILASLAGQFGDIKTAVDGLDLSTQAGIDRLRKRGTELLSRFKADGVITDDEQKILDAFTRILNAAVDVFDTIGEKAARALAKVADDNAILGGDQRTQFGRTVGAARGLNGALDGILGSVDLTNSAGAEAFRTQLQSLYTSLLQDGLTDEETVIVDLIKTLLGGLSNAIDEGKQEAEAKLAKAASDRQARQSSASRTANVTDAEGVQAYTLFLSGLADSLSGLFSEFDVSNLQGVDAAKARLVALNSTIDGLSDEDVMAQFGLTKDELIAAILALDSSFDGLKASAQSAAQAALDLANAQRDFSASVEDDFLRASGQNKEADLNAAKARTEARLKTAKELGASQSEVDKINATGALEIADIVKRYAETAANTVQSVAATGSSATDARTSFVASGVSSITELQAVRLTDLAQSSLLVQRSILNALTTPRLLVPSLPPGVGVSTQSADGVYITIQVAGNLSTKEAARELAKVLAPEISVVMRTRASGLQAQRGS